MDLKFCSRTLLYIEGIEEGQKFQKHLAIGNNHNRFSNFVHVLCYILKVLPNVVFPGVERGSAHSPLDQPIFTSIGVWFETKPMTVVLALPVKEASLIYTRPY